MRLGKTLVLPAVALLWCAQAAAADPIKIAVLPVDLDPTAKGQVPSLINDIVLTAVHELGPQFDVIGQDDIEAMLGLEKQKDLLGCESSASCIADIGGALGVDKLVSLKVAKIGTDWVTTAKLIDIKKTRVEERASRFTTGDARALLHDIPKVVQELFGVKAGPSAAELSQQERLRQAEEDARQARERLDRERRARDQTDRDRQQQERHSQQQRDEERRAYERQLEEARRQQQQQRDQSYDNSSSNDDSSSDFDDDVGGFADNFKFPELAFGLIGGLGFAGDSKRETIESGTNLAPNLMMYFEYWLLEFMTLGIYGELAWSNAGRGPNGPEHLWYNVGAMFTAGVALWRFQLYARAGVGLTGNDGDVFTGEVEPGLHIGVWGGANIAIVDALAGVVQFGWERYSATWEVPTTTGREDVEFTEFRLQLGIQYGF